MCAVLDISPKTYYKYRNPGPKEKNEYSRFIEDEKAIAYKLKQLSDNRM